MRMGVVALLEADCPTAGRLRRDRRKRFRQDRGRSDPGTQALADKRWRIRSSMRWSITSSGSELASVAAAADAG
jgi:hypothetical protein